VFSYPDVVDAMLARPTVPYLRFPFVTPAWVNTARRRNGGATNLYGFTPSAYGHWLRSLLADQQTLDQLPEPFLFINAWNEWAEGNHLEPVLQMRHGFLQQTEVSLH
jgi:hypothetical protein